MNKRDRIYAKCNGKCAYTGKPLGEDWQVDHVMSIQKANYLARYHNVVVEYESEANLIPCLRIVNHYKRGFDLDGFREYMVTFHLRLGRLPKKTKNPATVKRIAYMNEIADSFGITPDKPFDGKFYFEKLEEKYE